MSLILLLYSLVALCEECGKEPAESHRKQSGKWCSDGGKDDRGINALGSKERVAMTTTGIQWPGSKEVSRPCQTTLH